MTFRPCSRPCRIVELPEDRGLAVKARAAAVKDEDVDGGRPSARGAARYDPVEGTAGRRPGDFAAARPRVAADEGGKGGRDENALIEVGGAGNHADMNAASRDWAPGDAGRSTVTYAADAPRRSWPARRYRYTVTLKGLKKKVVPGRDDEFAKDLGDFDSLAELLEGKCASSSWPPRSAGRPRRQGRARRGARSTKASFEVPEALVERHMSARAENVARGLAYQGIDPRKVGVDWAQYRESARGLGEGRRADILLDEIAT